MSLPDFQNRKIIKCPHCGTLLPEGADLCCPALRDELNKLANSAGRTIEELRAVFDQWFRDHEYKEGAQHAN